MRTPPAAGTLARAWPHHLLLGHKLAVIELRSGAPLANLGITLNLDVTDPLDPTDPGDAEAALLLDGQHTRIFLDSLLRGACPADVEHLELLSEVKDGDLEIISAKIDTLDVNYYHCQAASCRPAHDAPSGAASGARQTSSPFPAAGGTPTRTRPSVDGHGLEGPGRGPTRLLVRLQQDGFGATTNASTSSESTTTPRSAPPRPAPCGAQGSP